MCHLLSSLHRSRSAGGGLGYSTAIPREGQSCVLALWDVAMPQHVGCVSCPSSTAWQHLSALLWVLPLCTHPAFPIKRCETSNEALTWAFQWAGLDEHPFWQLSPVLLSFLLGQLPVSALGPLNYLSSTTWHRTSGTQDGLACEWLVLVFRMQFNLHCKGSSAPTDLGT